MVLTAEKAKKTEIAEKVDETPGEEKSTTAQHHLVNDQTFDFMFKILLIGNSAVGKTSFLFRYCDDSFTSAFISTVGIDFKVKSLRRNERKVKLQIWDTAGHERYRTITTAYYRGAMGFILMYDVTSEDSFNSVQDWATQIRSYASENVQVLLVGNKCDLNDRRKVSTDRGASLAAALKFAFIETSVKENINVEESFNVLVDLICAQAEARRHAASSRSHGGEDSLANGNDDVMRLSYHAERVSSTCSGASAESSNADTTKQGANTACFCSN